MERLPSALLGRLSRVIPPRSPLLFPSPPLPLPSPPLPFPHLPLPSPPVPSSSSLSIPSQLLSSSGLGRSVTHPEPHVQPGLADLALSWLCQAGALKPCQRLSISSWALPTTGRQGISKQLVPNSHIPPAAIVKVKGGVSYLNTSRASSAPGPSASLRQSLSRSASPPSLGPASTPLWSAAKLASNFKVSTTIRTWSGLGRASVAPAGPPGGRVAGPLVSWTLQRQLSTWGGGCASRVPAGLPGVRTAGPFVRSVYKQLSSWRSNEGLLVAASRRSLHTSAQQQQSGLQSLLRGGAFSGGGADPNQVVFFLIGCNVAVFLGWHWFKPTFMWQNFAVSVESLRSLRLHTLVTSAFSQREPGHLLANMLGLYFFGPAVASYFGTQTLLTLYLSGAVLGSLAHVAHYTFLVPRLEKGRFFNPLFSPPAMGASGAINAITLFYMLMFPTHTIYLYGLLPLPAWLLGTLFIGMDVAGVLKEGSRTSHAGHLGGALAGAILWAQMRTRRGRWR